MSDAERALLEARLAGAEAEAAVLRRRLAPAAPVRRRSAPRRALPPDAPPSDTARRRAEREMARAGIRVIP